MSTAGNTGLGNWNPEVYLNFAAYRARPADDLIPRLDLKIPGMIYDLGCGPGTLTKRLKDRWPDRTVIGMDASESMLAEARKKFGDGAITWQHGDIAAWQADEPAALVFANASLHWLGDHERLMPRLMQCIAPGGVLAVQMPMTGDAPYQRCVRAVSAMPRWREKLKNAETHDDPLPAGVYYDLLSPLSQSVDIWETHYHHVLSGENPVLAWTSGATLVPMLSVLSAADKPAFMADYGAKLADAYPPQADGAVLFTMRRIFIVATRA